MQRPVSIVQFERCYLAAFLIGVLNTVLAYSETQARMTRQVAMFGPYFLPVATAIGFAITLSIWYFAARRGSVVAKWVATVFLALGLIGIAIALPSGRYPQGISGVLGITSTILQAISVWLLFRPDARPWFGEDEDRV